MSITTVLVDGAPATVEDLIPQALQTYGAYSSFRVEGGGVRGLADHLARLDASAIELFGEAVGEARLRELMLIAVADRPDGWLRVSLFSPEIGVRNPSWRGRPQVMTVTSPAPAPLAASLRLAVQTYGREAAHLKHTAIFGLIRARRAARGDGFDDALFVDGEGVISEGSVWNIGFLDGDRIVWPQAPMLAGVAQILIERGAASQSLSCSTQVVRLSDLSRFDGAFICNSATPACAVSAIGDHAFATGPDRIAAVAAAWAANRPQPI